MNIKSKLRWAITWVAMLMLKRSLRYRISGENAQWLQHIPATNISIYNRVDFILEQCRNKRVLHIGFVDYPFTIQKINDGSILHLQLQKVTKDLLGLDNNDDTIHEYCKATGDTRVVTADITKHYPVAAIDFNPEIILFSEVAEHLACPLKAVNILYDSFANNTKILVTVPNYTALDSIASGFNKTEGIHPDHYWYFSPYTLCKLFDDKKFTLEQLHFGMYYLQHTKINNLLQQFPYNGDCIMAIFSINKNMVV